MKVTFSAFAQTCIERQKRSGSFSIVHLYGHAVRSFGKFLGRDVIRFSDITPQVLKTL
ncbi:MAG: phage integrase SAM-like domain-containing protein [Prevotella sp.]